MRRLWIQLWLAVLAFLFLVTLALSAAWWHGGPRGEERAMLDGAAELASALLPPADGDAAATEAALERAARALRSELTLRSGDGALVAAVGEPLPPPPPGRETSAWGHGRRHAVSLRLADGRWLLVRRPPPPGGFWLFGGALVLAVGLGAYPVVRRLTARLERLQRQVDALGRGELSARVDVRGRDEVARLAASFNAAAARIEALVAAQRETLAAASHELRSPLARLRLALELLGDTAPGHEAAALRARAIRDVAELDALVDEILLASRLEAQGEAALRGRVEEVDVLALAAEEAARLPGDPPPDVTGEAALVIGVAALLRRLVRNLLENARRHAPGAAIAVQVARAADGGARLTVDDAGPGVPEAERERIFAPFHRPAGWSEGAGGGAGLGLALVRRIARLHGGDARCLARPGGGTRFEVALAARPAAGR